MTSKLILAEKNIKKENDLFFRASQKKQHENKHPKKKKQTWWENYEATYLKNFKNTLITFSAWQFPICCEAFKKMIFF